MDNQKTNEDTVKNAKAALSALSIRNKNGRSKMLSPSTLKEYQAITHKLSKYAGSPAWYDKWVEYFDTSVVSVSTWRKERAAAMHSLATDIIEFLDHEIAVEQYLLEAHTDCLTKLMKLKPPSSLKRKPKSSKRKILSQLNKVDPTWRETIISRMPKYRVPLLVMAISGCRPAELQRGVVVELGHDVIRFTINGVKVTDHSGQLKRNLEVSINSKLGEMLARELRSGNVTNPVKIENALNLTTAIRSAGKRAYPKLKGTVTSYCFRHQCAADWKSQSDGSDDSNLKISMALGHRADHTKQYYGYQQQGGSGVLFPQSVAATSQVKSKNKLQSLLAIRNRKPSLH